MAVMFKRAPDNDEVPFEKLHDAASRVGGSGQVRRDDEGVVALFAKAGLDSRTHDADDLFENVACEAEYGFAKVAAHEPSFPAVAYGRAMRWVAKRLAQDGESIEKSLVRNMNDSRLVALAGAYQCAQRNEQRARDERGIARRS